MEDCEWNAGEQNYFLSFDLKERKNKSRSKTKRKSERKGKERKQWQKKQTFIHEYHKLSTTESVIVWSWFLLRSDKQINQHFVLWIFIFHFLLMPTIVFLFWTCIICKMKQCSRETYTDTHIHTTTVMTWKNRNHHLFSLGLRIEYINQRGTKGRKKNKNK